LVAGDDEGMQGFAPVESLFTGRHFDRQIIISCVTWYTSFKLSLRDLVIMMADRGIAVNHTTILRWVQRYLQEFEKRGRRYARSVGGSWRMDETYIRVRGRWVYLYRAVDKTGQTVDFFLSRNRDVTAAKLFLRSAMKNTPVPTKITLDAYAASHRAVREMKTDGELPRRVRVRSSQYLNNLVEQDHRRVKQRIRPMLGFKRFDNAVITISGIELAEKIKKGQFKTPPRYDQLNQADPKRSRRWPRFAPEPSRWRGRSRVCNRAPRWHPSAPPVHNSAGSASAEVQRHRSADSDQGRAEVHLSPSPHHHSARALQIKANGLTEATLTARTVFGRHISRQLLIRT
jgi:transposase-like protein